MADLPVVSGREAVKAFGKVGYEADRHAVYKPNCLAVEWLALRMPPVEAACVTESERRRYAGAEWARTLFPETTAELSGWELFFPAPGR